MSILQVMYAIETPVILKNEVSMTLAQLDSNVRICAQLIWSELDFKKEMGELTNWSLTIDSLVAVPGLQTIIQ